ncbi:MAG: hypothetical protein ACP5EN_17055, partial [Rhodovulum sp.]
QGLISLAGKHPANRIDRACAIALGHQAFRLRTIRTLIRRDVDLDARQSLPGWIDEHPIIRPLTDYAQLVRQAFHHPAQGVCP